MSAAAPDVVLAADQVFDGDAFLGRGAVAIRGGRIAEVVRGDGLLHDGDVLRLPPGAILAPGFVDAQVNGGGGALFNDDPSVATLARIAEAHRRAGGTTALLPTLISDHREVIRAAVATVADAIAQRVPGIVGIHLEGPFLNPSRKGIHDPARLAEIAPGDVELLASLGRRGVTLVTLAPERVPPGTIAALVGAGAIVAAGHTEASEAQLAAAVQEGLTGVTHLFNAMSQMSPREAGTVGFALAEPRLFAGIIADGHHVGDRSLAVAARMKGRRLMLVTDAMPPVGDPANPSRFTLFGRTIRREGDRLSGEDGTLAGALLDMAGAVRHLVRRTPTSLADALAMATSSPADFLGLSPGRGRLAPGARADLVALDADLSVIGSCLGGHWSPGRAAP